MTERHVVPAIRKVSIAEAAAIVGQQRPFARQPLVSRNSSLRVEEGSEPALNLLGRASAALFEVAPPLRGNELDRRQSQTFT